MSSSHEAFENIEGGMVMKKVLVFIMFVAVLFTAIPALGDTVSVKEGESQLNYRTEASYKVAAAGYIEAGKDYEVVGKVLSWVKVKIEDIKRGSIEGWVGAKILLDITDKTIIGGKGCTLRTEPNSRKNGTADGFVWPKSVVTERLDEVVNFYKIKADGKEVYVSGSYCVLKAKK